MGAISALSSRWEGQRRAHRQEIRIVSSWPYQADRSGRPRLTVPLNLLPSLDYTSPSVN